MSTKIICEGEINHNGEVELAKKIVDGAKECGADFVKFQCFKADGFIAPGSGFLPIFKDNELSLEDFREIKAHSESVGITMISTASDMDGLDMIVDLDLPLIKIGSTNITNVPLLEGIAETKKPVYLSTGASTLGEIEAALEILSRGTSDITLFHCTVQYPSGDSVLNLRAMQTMQSTFPNTAVGYSDHSLGSVAAVAAVALGATVIEKHFTVDKTLPGPDHGFSADPAEFKELVDAVRRTDVMLGSAIKAPSAEEQAVRTSGRRYMTAMCDIAEGKTLEPEMIRPRRIDVSKVSPDGLIGPEMARTLEGWQAVRSIPSGAALTLNDVRPGESN